MRQRFIIRRHSGYILLPVVLLISLVAVAAFTLNNEAVLETRVTASSVDVARAEYVANAGLQHARWQVEQASCGPYTDIGSEGFGNHSYSAIITPNNAGGSLSTFTVAVTDDAWIKSDTPTQNYGADAQLTTYFNILSPSTIQRTLYRFDIAAAGIPAGEMVVSAVARIFVLDSNSLASVTAHRITADWTEAAVIWDNINSNHESSFIASIPTASPVGQYVEVNITSLVQGWVNGSIANQGILLKSAFIGDLTQYTSKEYGTVSQRPELIIKVADGSLSNRVDISATGTLSSGITLTKIRTDIPLYQPSSTVVLQPDATQGKDNWLYEWKSSWNYGADNEVCVENRFANSIANSLFEFELGAIPAGVKILSASLALHQNTPSLNGGTIGVHRMSTPWVEGTQTGGSGASSWSEKDSGVSWTTAGGDYDLTAVSNTIVTASTVDWFEWEISSLVQGWVDGDHENYGLALVAEVYGTAAHFDSSDHTDPTLRPKLTITYACECGVTCQSPQGSGNVLLVVGDDVTLAAADVKKQALFAAWGYTINLIDDAADQATFDAALANNDVAYISETVWGPTLADKLAVTDKGVVNEEEDQNYYLGLSSSGSNIVNGSMEIIDNSHYITALFANGAIPIFSAPMEAMLVTGSPASGLQTLGDFAGTASLALVDGGGTLQGGSTAPGRRVAIPIGRNDKFNWDYLNNNGRLIVQRAIQWGTGNTGGFVPPNLLMVVVDPGNLTSSEVGKKTQVESWGYAVSVIDESDSQNVFDAALANNDVVYISEEALSTEVGTKLTGATIGVVTEEDNLSDEFGLSDGIQWQSGTTLDIVNNSHYISQPFSLGSLTVLNTSQAVVDLTGTLAPDLQVLANSALGPALVAVDAGASIIGGTAAGRRVQLPWGDNLFEINRLTADGMTIFERALAWAAGTGSSCSADYLPDNKVSAFSPSGIGSNYFRGATYLPQGLTFKGVAVPVGGAYLTVDSEEEIFMTDIAGVIKTSCTLPSGATLWTDGISYVESGAHAGELAVVYNGTSNNYIEYFDLECNSLATTFSTDSFGAAVPSGVSYIGLTGSGTYDDFMAVTDRGSETVHIVDQNGVESLVLDVSAFVGDLSAVVHLPGTDKLLLADAGNSKVHVIDFVSYSGTALAAYDLTTFAAVDSPEGIAINGLTCEHVVGSEIADSIATLNSLGGGGGGGPTGVVLDAFTEAKRGNSGTSLTLDNPDGSTSGDLLIAAVSTDGSTKNSLAAPAGWNVVIIEDRSSEVTFGVWWKLATASESSSYNFTWSGGEQAYGWLMRFTGHDPASPINAVSDDKDSSSSPVSPAVTTTVDDAMILRLGGFDDDDITAGAPGLSGHTAINMNDSGNGPATTSAGSAYVMQATAGDSGTANFNLTGTEENVTVTIAITPAP